MKVWSHIDDGSCPGQGIGVRTRLENSLSGFILTKNLSDQQVTSPEQRVKVYMGFIHVHDFFFGGVHVHVHCNN